MPIIQPRVEYFESSETDYLAASAPVVTDPNTGIPVPGTTILVDQSGSNLTSQPIGLPTGLDLQAVSPQFGTVHYGIALSPLSVTANGTDQITVTFGAVHGLSTNSQIVVQGLASTFADGAYSITVTTATAFTYQTNDIVPAQALLTGTTLMWTANIGLPYSYDQIPLTGTSGANGPSVGPHTENGIILEQGGFLLQENGYYLLQG